MRVLQYVRSIPSPPDACMFGNPPFRLVERAHLQCFEALLLQHPPHGLRLRNALLATQGAHARLARLAAGIVPEPAEDTMVARLRDVKVK